MENKKKGRGLLYVELVENVFWLVWIYLATMPTNAIMASAFLAGIYDTIMIFMIPAVLIGLPCGIIGVVQAIKYKAQIGWVRIPLLISSVLNSLVGAALVIFIIIAFVMAPNA